MSNKSTPFDRGSYFQDGAARPAIRISMLPKTITSESLKNMLVFAKDLVQTELVPTTIGDGGFQTAIAQFHSIDAAEEARIMLNGKRNASGDAHLKVDLVQRSPGGSYIPWSNRPSDATNLNRPSSRFNGTFQNLEQKSPPRPTNFTNGESSKQDAYGDIFSPQSPSSQPPERQRISGKSMIGEDAADDETGKIINDPVAFAKNNMTAVGMHAQPRRPTLPQIPTTGLNGYNIPSGPSTSTLHSPRGPPLQSPTLFVPPGLNGAAMNNGFHMPQSQYQRPQMPPVNPADQNPPCNTLYVGNLPVDTSEDELKHLFSKQRGYKRLCFRTKSNGPMCFVEFESVTYATKTLNELYGQPLSNSTKGGIRLSFSKNPLGVRGQHNGLPSPLSPQGPMSGMNGYGGMQSLTSVNGPPPGLFPPPGFNSPIGQMSNNHNFSPNGSSLNDTMRTLTISPISPNGTSGMQVRSPTATTGGGLWNGPGGNAYTNGNNAESNHSVNNFGNGSNPRNNYPNGNGLTGAYSSGNNSTHNYANGNRSNESHYHDYSFGR